VDLKLPRSLRIFAVLAVAAVLLLLATHGLWLRAVARVLIRDQGPAPSDIAVVLGGDPYGHRIVKAAELVRQHYVPAVLVSGPGNIYDLYESDLAIPFAVKRGYPPNWFIPCRHDAVSTETEAWAVIPELRRLGVRRILLVTSDYHTARAGRIFRAVARAAGSPLEIRTVAAPDEFFTVDSWWRSRQGAKTLFLEWSKTAARLVGF
jgi:uncharacterized SAM-binding protein YcdF (DUF218 family)